MAGRNLCIRMIDTGKFRAKVENPRFEQSGILRSGKNQEWKKPGWKIPVRSFQPTAQARTACTKTFCLRAQRLWGVEKN